MKEIIVIVRPNKLSLTKKCLVESGYPGFTCNKIKGRGRKQVKLHIDEENVVLSDWISKRMLSIIIPDEAEETVVQALLEVNSTQTPGDGKIFVCPIERSYRVRTREMIED